MMNMNMNGFDEDARYYVNSYFDSISANLPYGSIIKDFYTNSGNKITIVYEWGSNPHRSSYIEFDYLEFKRNKIIEDLLNSL
jgi:hypothetical protein